MIYFDKVTWALTERRVEAALPVLVELRGSLILSELIQQEATGPSLDVAHTPKVEV